MRTWLALMFVSVLFSSVTLLAAEPIARQDLPVILVTGFEPFGEGRPPNPSWEGAKRLDGVEWRGHRIVARQLPVIWGAPREHLAKWTAEFKPVAIFAFGQGGGYAMETVADNRRGKAGDNDGKLPISLKIEANGPDQYAASIDGPALAKLLAKKGYRVAVSKEAGNYLCEECLYSLEHWKATHLQPKVDVLFCHVPPLSKDYQPADVEKFMLAVLESWRELKEDK